MPSPLTDFEKKKQFLLEHEEYLIYSISFRCTLTHEQLRKYQNILEWSFLVCSHSINWTTEIMDEFKDRIFEKDDPYPEINNNSSLPWSIEFIERYKDLWDWELLGQNDKVIGNPEIRKYFYSYLYEYIEQYENLCNSPNNDEGKSEADIIEQKLSKLDTYTEWRLRSAEEIDRTENINWRRLSMNEVLPWSKELIEKYKDKWDWEGLTMNQSIPWTLELIKQFEDKIDWFVDRGEPVYCVGTLSGNMSVPWDAEILSTYRHRLNRSDVSIGQNAKWDINLLIQFEDFWDYDILVLNHLIWEKVFPEFDSEEQINELLDVVLERRK
jgi:hypothetical protein